MYALFEDAGKFHAGRLMTEADSSAQIELDSGKRVKVKTVKPTSSEQEDILNRTLEKRLPTGG